MIVDFAAVVSFGQGDAGMDLHRHLADRGGEHSRRRHGNAGQRDVVDRTQYSGTTHATMAQGFVCRRRHRTRVAVAGVGDHHSNRLAEMHLSVVAPAREACQRSR